MKCIRAFSCSCLNDTMAAFRYFSTGWCCKILCFQCWFRRFPENTKPNLPLSIFKDDIHKEQVRKICPNTIIHTYIVREKDIYIYVYVSVEHDLFDQIKIHAIRYISICLIILILVLLFSFTYIPSSSCCKKKPSYHLHFTMANPTSHSRVQCGNLKPHLSLCLCFKETTS